MSTAGSAVTFGTHLNRGFQAYLNQWQQWIVPMLVSAAIYLVSYCCCCFPTFFVMGPLTCGLYACAIRNVRNEPVELSVLNRGLDKLGTSMGVGLALMLLQSLPAIILLPAFYLPFILAAISAGSAGEPPPAWFAVGSLFWFAFWFVGMFALMVWSLWIGTRTMFAMPLVADRGVDFSSAFRESWRETRLRFWELLLLNFLAGLIGMLGMYVCYVGVLFSMPLYFTIIAAAYEDRFGKQETPALSPAANA